MKEAKQCFQDTIHFFLFERFQVRNGRIQHIDVWRFIAIALVLVSHLVRFVDPLYQNAVPEIISAVRRSGLIGVQIFFCISGFVICRGMMREFQESGRVSMRGFYIRRAYRILPALTAYILSVAVLVSLGVFDLTVFQFMKAGAFLCNFPEFGPSCSWALGHTWSLAYEEQFYLVFPLLFVWGAVARNKSFFLKLTLLMISLSILALVWKNSSVTTYLGHVLFMLMGCLIALYWKKIEPRLMKLPTGAWFAVVLVVLAIGLLPQPLPLKRLYAFVLPVLICVAVFGTPIHRPSVQVFFANPILAHLGRMSYSIYLWQQLATANYGFTSPLIIAVVLVASTFVLAHYSYEFFELPLVKKGNRLAAKYAMARMAAGSDMEEPDELPEKIAA